MSAEPLRVGIMGAGSVGCYVGGRLLAANAADVVMVGRPWLREEIANHGLRVIDPGIERVVPADRVRIEPDASALASCEVVLVCVKSAQTAEAARELAAVARADAVIVSLQNGVRNAQALRSELGDRVVAGIVGFNVVSKGSGVYFRGMTGPIQLADGPNAAAIATALEAAGLELELHDDLAPYQWTKLVVNLNNAVSAISGAPTVELLRSSGYRKIVAAVIEEAVDVLRTANIKLARLRGLPIGVMPFVLRMPTWIVRVVTRAQMKVDPEARSSMWEDLNRGRLTEVEFLNGEIVELATRSGVEAPLNRRIVKLIHEAEARGERSPGLDAAALWAAITGPR